jgi:hypothetical protein
LNQPHLANTVLTPQRFGHVPTFPIYMRAVPGKPIVIMCPPDAKFSPVLVGEPQTTASAGELALAESLATELAEKFQPDFGVVAAFEPRRDTKGKILYRDDETLHLALEEAKAQGRQLLVAVTPYTGVWLYHSDEAWIPEGRIVKILGSAEDWSRNLLAIVDLPEPAYQIPGHPEESRQLSDIVTACIDECGPYRPDQYAQNEVVY